ncbi:gliding motility-associated C-terminal domain-containing protein [Flavobacterium chuncheonense]|uniref:Gliding motility-associated C-terminal domain-containing protein n=1 Tax=Flavobacterium chuncheonense TaxID=2026653 RepID=A0ABW5YPC7_9FLAO
MKLHIKIVLYTFLLLNTLHAFSQDISLYTQWNGRYDFTFIGNTMNPVENTNSYPNGIFTSSTATLNLQNDDTIIAAYLYWAGMGTGDTEIKLNGTDMTPDILFGLNGSFSNYDYFSAFKDITSFVQSTGNGDYTLSDFDLNYLISTYIQNATQFAGWAILVIYENQNLALNQINVYHGYEALSPNPYVVPPIMDSLTINLDNLYLISNTGAKIGFIAWEGDSGLATNEELHFSSNGVTNILSNSLNPPTNAFNGTSTETNSATLYNMDLDIYSIENYIVPGTTSATVTLQSGHDYVMLNTIVTKLNSQLPDATVTLSEYNTSCDIGNFSIAYTVNNTNSTDVLPANTTIGFYINNILIGTATTQNDIPIGGSETGVITLIIPLNAPENFTLTAIVDYTESVPELNEDNNSFNITLSQWLSPISNGLPPLETCNLGLTKGVFDFSSYENLVVNDNNDNVSFHESQEDALSNSNPILNTSNYETSITPKEIFVRIENELGCFSITSFILLTKNCPPTVYNAVSANNDGMNDDFFIDGLRDIFVNFKLEIYSRWGRLLWTGDNTIPNWNGYVAEGINNKKAPEGTYYYILYLNDPDYPKPLTGYLYLNR